LNLTEAGTQHFMQDGRMVELVLDIEPRNISGQSAAPASFAGWRDRLVLALQVPSAFATFLTNELGLRTYDDPPTQLGFRLEAWPNLAELVDITGFAPVAGSPPRTSFPSYFKAERNRKSPAEAALDGLRVWCDHGLYISGYDVELSGLQGN
jgi:hypothetical protein